MDSILAKLTAGASCSKSYKSKKKKPLGDFILLRDEKDSHLMAVSKTFINWKPDPIDFIGSANGAKLYSLSKFNAVIVKSENNSNGAVHTYIAFSFTQDDHGWSTWYNDNPSAQPILYLKNSTGGVLLQWHLNDAYHYKCGRGVVAYFQMDLNNPDLYDLVTELTFSPNTSQTRWFQVCH